MEPLIFTFAETRDETIRAYPSVTVSLNGQSWGDPLNDNSHQEDFYRYHDVFHLGVYALSGGQSPVMRHFLANDPTRTPPAAWQLEREEVLSIISFTEAKMFGFYQSKPPSRWLVNTLDDLSAGTDLHALRGRWRQTLQTIYPVFNELVQHRGGQVSVDPQAKQIQYII